MSGQLHESTRLLGCDWWIYVSTYPAPPTPLPSRMQLHCELAVELGGEGGCGMWGVMGRVMGCDWCSYR
jgi:hypothetical protein